MEVIYADIYFVVNLSMDFLTLFITAKLRKLPARALRLLFAAAVGGGYAVARLFISGRVLPLILTVAVPFLMCYIAYGFGRIGHYLLNTLTFWLVSWLMGGLLTAVYYFAGRLLEDRKIYINGRTEALYSDIPFWVIIVIAVCAALVTLLWNRLAERRMRSSRASVTVIDRGNEISFDALCDSGNMLVEPIGNLPVIIISPEILEKLLPEGIEPLIYGSTSDMLRVRVLPYSTVSGSGMTYGYLPDRILVGGVEKRACLCAPPDPDTDFGSCGAIIPTSLL